MKKITIQGKVYATATLIRLLIKHLEFRNWAIHSNMGNYLSIYESALIKEGFDYGKLLPMIADFPREQLNRLSTHELTLYCDAKASTKRFSISDENHQPISYGFFKHTDDYSRQDHSELAVARRAVEIAGQIAKQHNIKTLRLHLYTDSRMLTFLDSIKRKGLILALDSILQNIDLYVHWIPGETNPADPKTTSNDTMNFDVTTISCPQLIKKIY